MDYRITGPKGGVLVKRATLGRLRTVLPGLVKRFKAVKVATAAPLPKPPVPAQTLGDKMFAEAKKWVGTKENPPGSNLNPFGAWYGSNGVPWCAEFVSYCANKAGSKFKYAYVPYVVNDARAGHNGLKVVSHAEVRRGDAVCFDWPGESTGVADHIGLFDAWVTPTTFTTVEGNTSAAGSQSNGGEVCRQTRYTGEVLAFVRLS